MQNRRLHAWRAFAGIVALLATSTAASARERSVLRRADPLAAARPASTIAAPSGDPVSLDVVLHFASAVALAGDEILVGRSGAAARPGSPNGGVHVFRADGRSGLWREREVLAPADVKPDDEFGAALAVAGRWLAVGAPLARQGRGAVYIFERTSQGRWLQRAALTAVQAAPGEHLGATVALRDGVVLAGAPSYENQRGRVVVFRYGRNGRWSEQAVLLSPDTSRMGFGQAVGVTEREAFVGAAAPLAPVRGPDGRMRMPDTVARAQVFVFGDSTNRWVPAGRLTRDTSMFGSQFGAALLAKGTELWVADPAASGTGAVFYFRRQTSGRWSPAGRLAPIATDVAGFGAALAHDGRDLLIGAPRSDSVAVYVFRADSAGGAWTEAQRIVFGDTASGGPHIPHQTGWFSGTIALAADHGLAAAGFAWSYNHEGTGVVLRRNDGGPASSAPANAGGASGVRWQVTATLADSAWTTRKPLTGQVVPCRRGQVKIFHCERVDLLAFLPIRAFGGDAPPAGQSYMEVSGIWGWNDSTTEREFALVARSDGVAFIEVTDPIHPRFLGVLPLHEGASPSTWRDIKVYKNHAYVVSDIAGAHGMQIFDLTQLRNVKGAPVTFRETAHYAGFGSAHTIAMNEVSGFAYPTGANSGGETCGGGLHMIDVRTPTKPTFAGCYAEPKTGSAGTGYTHETLCVTYHGPDAQYKGREICINSSETAVGIADVTDKKTPKTISIVSYPNASYVHQGWLTEDQRYFFLDDELDEGQRIWAERDPTAVRTRTLVFDLRELSDPLLVKEFLGTTGATDHNLYIRGHYMYQSDYTAGLRIIDVSDPRNPSEVGYFDTAPAYADTPPLGAHSTIGTWSNYPFFKSGTIAVTSMREGLYLLRFR